MSQAAPPRVVTLKLYVTGSDPRSMQALEIIEAWRKDLPPGAVDLDVVDILRDPQAAEEARILTTPTLMRVDPKPARRLIGDGLSNGSLDALLLAPVEHPPPHRRQTDVEIHERPEQVIARAAHELRTPVAVVKGFSTTMRNSLKDLPPEAITPMIDAIERSMLQLETILETMLQTGRMEAGGIRLDLTVFDLGDLVVQTARDLKQLTAAHPVSITVEDVVVEADIGKVRQIVTNLLSNAVKFSKPDAPIEIEVLENDDGACVSVRDHGIGIPPERLGDLFKRYSRIERGYKGMGLGLYISREFARAHGGDITAESDGSNGSTFVLSLPQRSHWIDDSAPSDAGAISDGNDRL